MIVTLTKLQIFNFFRLIVWYLDYCCVVNEAWLSWRL